MAAEERKVQDKHTADQVQKLAPLQDVAWPDSDLVGDSSKMVVDMVVDRRLAAVGKGTAGRAEHGWLALVFGREGYHRKPDLGVMDGESEGRGVPLTGIAG